MNKPDVITATFRIVTPMFIGDADQEANSIRPPSVKGALRFWWRALNWGRIHSAADSDQEGLKELHKQESQLFGSATDKHLMQCLFILKVLPVEIKIGAPDSPGTGIQYLLGQGLYRFNNGFQRNALLSGDFVVQCILKPSISPVQQSQLLDTLLAFGLLGGLGSRSRRGFGSVSITSLKQNQNTIPVPANTVEYTERISRWAAASNSATSVFTAFSSQTRIDSSLSGSSPDKLLNRAGEELQAYRSYGKNGVVNGKNSERKFEDDHDNVLNVANGASPAQLPKRSVFGFPHNYFYSSSKKKVDIAPKIKGRARRASPLFIHTHQFADGKSLLIQSLLPAIFLMEGEVISFNITRNNEKTLEITEKINVDWDVIHTYMDRFEKRERLA